MGHQGWFMSQGLGWVSRELQDQASVSLSECMCGIAGHNARSRCGAHSDSAHLDLAPERNAAVSECKIRSERGIKVRRCGITLVKRDMSEHDQT